MIIETVLPHQQIAAIQQYLSNHNLGNRGFEDGSPRKQEIGLIGEWAVYHYLHGEYPDLTSKYDGFDGGYDLTFSGKKIDVKTMERKSYVKPNYVNNFYTIQQRYDADLIVFCSYHNVANIVEICGWLPKSELVTRGIYYAAGTQRLRSDGTTFTFRQNNYEVEVQNLEAMVKLKLIAG